MITIIRYGKKAKATIVYKTNEPDRTFELDDSGMKELHSVAFMESASERENHSIKEVQIFLPLKLLKVWYHSLLKTFNLFTMKVI